MIMAKKPKVRHAKAGDRNLFKKLWLEYLTESYESKDSEIKPSQKNLETYGLFFDLYVEKKLQGLVLFIGESAVLMWGSIGATPFEMDTVHRAMGWGTFVKPDARRKGYSKLIRTEAAKLLKEMGFETVVGEVKHGGKDFDLRIKAAESAGVVPYATLWMINLKEM